MIWRSSNTIRTGHDATDSTLLTGGQYARGQALDDRHIICKERFIPVYRLDEDGDLQDEGGAQAFVLGVKSSLL